MNNSVYFLRDWHFLTFCAAADMEKVAAFFSLEFAAYLIFSRMALHTMYLDNIPIFIRQYITYTLLAFIDAT